MTSTVRIDVADAIADPASVFSHPNEVVRMEALWKHDKRAILESWKKLEEERIRMADGSQIEGRPGLLNDIETAIGEVG